MELDKIGNMTQGDLRRFIVNLLLSDPGALPKHLTPAAVASTASSPLTTKGDLFTHDTADTRLPVGTAGQVLSVNLAVGTGLQWIAPPAGTTPTGTGFRHVTAGAEDAASKLVDTADINADQVTYPKIQNVASNNRLLGRVSGAGGDIEELTAAQVNTLIGAPGTPTGTGFTHETAGVQDAAAKLVDTADINADQVTYAKIQNVTANNRILGRISGAFGDVEELSSAQVATLINLLFPTGTGFWHSTGGAQDAATKLVDTADINNDQVTYGKMQPITQNRLLGNNGIGLDIVELTAAQVLVLLGVATTPTGTGFTHETGGVQDAAAKLVDTADINNNQVTYAKMQDETNNTMLGRFTVADGDPQELFVSDVRSFLQDPSVGYNPGNVTWGTERFEVQYAHLKLSSTNRLTLQGTNETLLVDLGEYAENYIGAPKAASISNVIRDSYRADVYHEFQLLGPGRLDMRGNGELHLSDDFDSRPRIVLSGRV